MTDKDLEFTKHRMEILRMARQMLNEQYINRRAEDHNRWLAEADQAWKNKGIRLPYPPFAPYPTEEQVLAKAQELLKFVLVQEEQAAEEKAEIVSDVPKSGPLFSDLGGLEEKLKKTKKALASQTFDDIKRDL
jgi:hypothetical protein